MILGAAADADAALTRPDISSLFDTWRHLETILIASANLSKIFWGNFSESRIREREPVRTVLGVPDDSPLRDRGIRNDFEHFDQRLIDHFAPGKPRLYLGRNIGSHDAVMIEGHHVTDRFQHYDPTTGVVTFFEHSVPIPPLARAAEAILQAAQARRLPQIPPHPA